MIIRKRQERARTLTYRQQTDCERWLQEICLRFLHYFPNVIEPRVFIAPDAEFKPGIAAHYWRNANRIDFKQSYFNCAQIWSIEMLMRHELIHAWTWFNAVAEDDSHGSAFQSMADNLKVWYDRDHCLPRRLS
jgi:hypothetical protein